MREIGLLKNGIEGIQGLFNRVQKLKEDLKSMLLYEDNTVADELKANTKNKILVVTHPMVMKALKSPRIEYNPYKENTIFNPFEFISDNDYSYHSDI